MKFQTASLLLFVAIAWQGVVAAPSQPKHARATSGLDYLFKKQGKKFWGSVGTQNNLQPFLSDLGEITPENSLKWDATEGSQGNFNFGADAIVSWATSNGKLVRGEFLVWHSQLPSWVSSISDKTTLTSVIQNHVSTVAGHYRGKIESNERTSYWQGFNHPDSEVLNEDGSMRSSVFFKVLGESFITIAFSADRAADPDAVLYINDYNLDSDNAKVKGMVSLVGRINAGQQYIDGIGTEMHLSGGVAGVSSALNALASTGLEVAITELDIYGCGSNDYLTVLDACLNLPACVSITPAPYTNSWRQNGPCLFDPSYPTNPSVITKVYKALIGALSALPPKTILSLRTSTG